MTGLKKILLWIKYLGRYEIKLIILILHSLTNLYSFFIKIKSFFLLILKLLLFYLSWPVKQIGFGWQYLDNIIKILRQNINLKPGRKFKKKFFPFLWEKVFKISKSFLVLTTLALFITTAFMVWFYFLYSL